MAITMWMPKSSAITVMMTNGVIPADTLSACTNPAPNQITNSSASKLSQ